MQMIYRRLTALFARYSAAHLSVASRAIPLLGDDAQFLGHIDRVSIRGQRLVIEGWADAGRIVVAHAGERRDLSTTLPRHDVTAKFPELARKNPGFAVDLPRGEGPVSLTLVRDTHHVIYHVPMPTHLAIRAAWLRLIPLFLRDLAKATPAILHWFATKDPADRARLKHHLRLTDPAPSRAMQRLLFLADSLAHMPAKQQNAERALLKPAALAHRTITIVMPVYNALDLLPQVLDRVLRHTDLPWRLILIDDASTDPAMRPFLRAWVGVQKAAYPGRVILIEHKVNQGFVRAVNAGLELALSYGEHVVLLNSDAFVPQAWATRLMRPFLMHDRVATVTPMSNDAEIFTAPVICQRGPLEPGEADAIDAVAAKIHPDASLADAPTGVGFCMAMSIDYLRRIPALDTAFGRGYGEEVDWCQKARAMGGRHLGLANLFVEHRGGSSFGSAEKQRLVARNNAIISARYPGYDAEVQGFIAADPLTAPRLALAIAWAAGRANAPLPLYLAHAMGGGAADYLTQRLARAMPNCALVLRVGTALRWQLELHSPHGIIRGSTDNFALIQRLLDPVKSLRIIYSCGVGDPDPADLPEKLISLQRGPQDRIEMLIHDYLPISPSYTLLTNTRRYLGLPDPATTDAAHCTRRPDGTMAQLQDWQASWGKLIAKATDITVFSQSSAEIFSTAYPMAHGKLRLAPHDMLVDLPQLAAPARSAPAVIGVLGNIGHHKGAGVLRDLSQMLYRSGAAKLVVLGQLDPSYMLAASATVHGGYQRADIPALVARYGITDWLIPSIWPETFSYTTHEALATGLPVWCFDLGAQADALRQSSRGSVVGIPAGVPDVDALLAALLKSHTLPQSVAA
jgi:O-antigen biosynthesis protein